MAASLARQRYLQRHMEPGLPLCPPQAAGWENVLVIPCYRESACLLDRLKLLPEADGRVLVILVLNRPDSDPDRHANTALRDAVSAIKDRSPAGLVQLNSHSQLYLHDLESSTGPIPASQGVGLARKIGCDIAFKWMTEGAIASRWLCITDADAMLPQDYFRKLQSIPAKVTAASFPFWHAPGGNEACNRATALYELRLHHYVLGLEYADSPYACHTLGSCLAVTFDGYAEVRGIPKRSGGEDFYMLNKLAKTGPVQRLAGDSIQLESRVSGRVPFGTGPAVAKIGEAQKPHELRLFYHPACYEALRGVLQAAPQLEHSRLADLPGLLAALGICAALQQACCSVLERLRFAPALEHCRRQSKSTDQFLRQFHQWFDAFRTLKFIHGIRDAGWHPCSLAGLRELQPALWPSATADDVAELRLQIERHWGWSR